MEIGQGGPGNSPAPSGAGSSLSVQRGEGLTAAYIHMSRRGYGWLKSVVFWFLHMRRLEEVVMTSLRTREGLSPAVSANPFVTSNHLVQVLR